MAFNSNGSTGTPAATTRIRRRNRMITSCLECRRRKLKCDKSQPCVNCTKAGRDCLFLAPALDSASQLKLTEIKEKMGSLEKVLEQDVAKKAYHLPVRKGASAVKDEEDEVDFAPEPEDERDLEPTPLATIDAAYDDDADDDFMDLGIKMGKMRITDRVGGFVRPKMHEELTYALGDSPSNRRPQDQAISPDPHEGQTLFSTSFTAPGPNYIAPSSGFFFASKTQSMSLMDFLPSKLAADRLIDQYWFAVHTIARIVHRPSFQRRYDSFWDEVQMGIEPVASLQALVFAAMFSGVVSMNEDQVLQYFGVSKRNLMENFQMGTETALARANLLRTTKIETLQAFIMYLIPLCRNEMSRAHSALCGAAIRIAECMGLHRDGSAYDLGAVETHVRRMIWHEICFLDLRTCTAQGPRPGIRKDDFDTEFPLNVDDAELEEYPPPKDSVKRWTDMTFTLMRMECSEMYRIIWDDRIRLERRKISLTAILGKIETFRRVMNEKYLPLIDDRIPIQHAARLVTDIATYGLHISVLHRYHNNVERPIPDRLRQIILTSGTAQMESAVILETSPSLQPWAWYSGAYQQYHGAFLLLVEVFRFPMRKEADRIWNCLDYIFETEAHLPRDQKARMILSELRDKMSVYKDLSKLRTPNSMNARFRASDKLKTDVTATSPVGLLETSVEPKNPQFVGVANGESIFALPSMQSPQGTSDSGSVAAASHNVPMTPQDTLMPEIDWDEWDKLFPPTINTGELNVPQC